jgi:hypothetical protein
MTSILSSKAAQVVNDLDFQMLVKEYSPWSPARGSPSETQRATVQAMTAIIACIERLALDGRDLPAPRFKYVTLPIGEPDVPSIVGLPNNTSRELSPLDWTSAAVFVVVEPSPLSLEAHEADAVKMGHKRRATLAEIMRERPGHPGKRPRKGSVPEDEEMFLINSPDVPGDPERESDRNEGIHEEPALTRTRANIEKIATEIISKDIRRHVMGVHIGGHTVRFWYFDRAGSVRTTSIDLRGDGEVFVGIMLALQCADDFTLGFGFDGAVAERAGDTDEDGATGSFPGLIVDGRLIELMESIYANPVLYGSATSFFRARLAMTQPSGLPKPVRSALDGLVGDIMVKLSWSPAGESQLSDQLFRLANSNLESNSPRLLSSSTVVRLSGSLRAQLCPTGWFQNLELHAQVLDTVCGPLSSVKNESTFRAAFRSLVEGNECS